MKKKILIIAGLIVLLLAGGLAIACWIPDCHPPECKGGTEVCGMDNCARTKERIKDYTVPVSDIKAKCNC